MCFLPSAERPPEAGDLYGYYGNGGLYSIDLFLGCDSCGNGSYLEITLHDGEISVSFIRANIAQRWVSGGSWRLIAKNHD